jgi:transglutaminase-like putative cysteine protease
MYRTLCWSIPALLLSAAALSAGEPKPKWKIEATDCQNIEARISYDIHMTNFLVSRWVIYMPEPPELPSQANVKITSTPKAKVVSEQSPLARKVRMSDFQVIGNVALARRVRVDLNVQATLRARKLVRLKEGETPPKVTPLTPTEAKYYTSATHTVDFNAKPFKNWLDKKQLHLQKGEQPVDFAARVLEVIRSDYSYHFTIAEKQASVVCDLPSGDCSCMAYIFVAAMRANDIPARALIGRFAKTRKSGVPSSDNEYEQPHVRAEIYVANVGWVPVDPAFANGNKTRKVQDFIGNDAGDILVLHVDVDLQLSYPNRMQSTQSMQVHPNYWAFGQGQFDGVYGDTGWELTTTPVKKK